ncbi:Signal transducer and activator of transcription b [Aphelenchoides bicaudatus]|nr:Signal transducer and activator of transcription b [Aphelenchoides bicaudatus]
MFETIQEGFQQMNFDSNSPIDNRVSRPEPSVLSPQICLDVGMEPLNAFTQSNQSCNNLLNQLVSTKNEFLSNQNELMILNKRFEIGSVQMIMTDFEVQQLQENTANFQNHAFELETKVEHIKTALLSQLEMTSTQIVNRAMHTLVADKLITWLQKQKLVSCGSRASIKAHYEALDEIDVLFEKCGQQIVFLLNSLVNAEQSIGHNTPSDSIACTKIQKLANDLIQSTRHFVWQSIIVSVQPPAVVVKCRVSDSHRSTRFPCKTELRILGGEALGVRDGSKSDVNVDLISEDVARQIQQDSSKSVVKDKGFNLIYNESRFQSEYTSSSCNFPAYRATFDRIRLVENAVAQKRSAVDAGLDEKKGTRRSKVSSLRYYLVFKLQTGQFLRNCQGIFGQMNCIEVSGYKLSLPIAALVHSSLEAEASLFWNRAFSQGTGILSQVPESVSWEQAKVALNLKVGQHYSREPRPLSAENFDHLAYRLGVCNGVLNKKNFFNKAIAHKENKTGNPVPSVFFEWFYRCGTIVNKYMSDQWNDNLVVGFCSKECAEKVLRATQQPTMLIRFSDLVIGHLKISCKLADNRVVHYETEAEKMPINTSIADAIFSNPTFSCINSIYPNKQISMLWQNRSRTENSRAEIWSGIIPLSYFDKVYSMESKPVAAIDK